MHNLFCNPLNSAAWVEGVKVLGQRGVSQEPRETEGNGLELELGISFHLAELFFPSLFPFIRSHNLQM